MTRKQLDRFGHLNKKKIITFSDDVFHALKIMAARIGVTELLLIRAWVAFAVGAEMTPAEISAVRKSHAITRSRFRAFVDIEHTIGVDQIMALAEFVSEWYKQNTPKSELPEFSKYREAEFNAT